MYAGDPRDAVAAARHEVYDPLVKRDAFATVQTFDEEDPGNGRDRWGAFPVVTRAETDEGRQLIRDGWAYTVKRYRNALENIEEFFADHERGELWLDREVNEQYAYDFEVIGQTEGPSTFLYDPDGAGIRTLPHLGDVLEGDRYLGDVADPDEFGLYVVPAEADT